MAAKYLVTGGAGFIGSNIVAALIKRGDSVRAFDNLATGHWGLLKRLVENPSQVEMITGDIRDAEAVGRAMQGVEVVFHEGALGSVPRSVELPVESDDVNVNGTVTVLDQARRNKVRRVIFAASSAGYGETPTLPKHEEMPSAPMSPYAVTKVTCEMYLKVFASLYGLETLNLRYFNVFGPNQLPNGPYAAAIPRFIHAALKNEPITIYGDGEQTRDFCYIANVVDANLRAADTTNKLHGQVVNIACGRRISLNEAVKAISSELGRSLVVNHVAPRSGDVRHSLADISRARELLGYEARATWESGIAPTIAFMRELLERGLS
jgi:nucleoside-diphosphate-sugar epimerase